MPALYDQYTRELHEEYGYFATWPPNGDLKLGDVGVLHRDRFENDKKSLSQRGIAFTVKPPGKPANFIYSSKGGVSFAGGALGSTPALGGAVGAAAAKMTVSFSRGAATLFVAVNCSITSIADREELGNAVMQRYEQGEWPVELMVVTELVTADSATILISKSANAKAEFSAKAQVGAPGLTIAGLGANVEISGQKDIGASFVAASGLTPLFKISGVRKRLFTLPTFDVDRFVGDIGTSKSQTAKVEAVGFAEVGYNDLFPKA